MSRRALITGANRGIGREIARQLAARGLHVVVAARRADAAEETAAALRQAGGVADGLELDVNDSTSIAAAARTFAERFGRLDVAHQQRRRLSRRRSDDPHDPPRQLVQTLETNTFGPIVVVQAFLPALRQSDRGPHHQRVQRLRPALRPVARRAELLPVEARAQRRHDHARRGARRATALP